MFRDRAEAGRRLADHLADPTRMSRRSRSGDRPLVLALPRGGLPVALPVAKALGADLDVIVVRKVGVPGNPEFAMGAVGEGGVLVLDDTVVRRLGVTEEQVGQVVARERAEVERRVRSYRQGRPLLSLHGRDLVIVDDGLATGSTAAAAIEVARQQGAQRITLAVPVGSREACLRLRAKADEVVCLATPDPFWAVGEHYDTFTQLTDDDVVAVLDVAHDLGVDREGVDEEVLIKVGAVALAGHLTMPADASGVVVFAHGTGSDRHSHRNRSVAAALQAAGLGTLLFDLVAESDAGRTIDVTTASRRLIAVTEWLQTQWPHRPVGFYGSSSGAAVALAAAAQRPDLVRAVVSRGGRPDLASAWLPAVAAPTLLIVGERDAAVLDVNREAERHLTCPHLLRIVNGAGHLFEETGTLAQAGALARTWFVHHLHEPATMAARHAS